MDEYQERYRVMVTGVALRQGRKLGISEPARAEIIEELKGLKYWPDSRDNFEYEMVEGAALEIKFQHVEGHWVRVFVFRDDERKIMWVIKVLGKKSNELRKVDLISLRTALSRMEEDLAAYRKEHERMKKDGSLRVLKGGTDE